jgi:hypothetical protein
VNQERRGNLIAQTFGLTSRGKLTPGSLAYVQNRYIELREQGRHIPCRLEMVLPYDTMNVFGRAAMLNEAGITI